MADTLAERLSVLRDEVLDTAERGEDGVRGAEVFDAVVRQIATRGETSPGLDMTLREGIARRLAWGDSESTVLGDSDGVCRKLLEAAERALRDPDEEMLVAATVADVGVAVSRFLIQAVLGRVGRERAAQLRGEMAQARLRRTLDRQREELDDLERL